MKCEVFPTSAFNRHPVLPTLDLITYMMAVSELDTGARTISTKISGLCVCWAVAELVLSMRTSAGPRNNRQHSTNNRDEQQIRPADAFLPGGLKHSGPSYLISPIFQSAQPPAARRHWPDQWPARLYYEWYKRSHAKQQQGRYRLFIDVSSAFISSDLSR